MTRSASALLIAGVKKGGTSSLFDYLAQHQDVCPSSIKETSYFSALIERPENKISAESYDRYFSACGGQRYRMEATPTYYYGGERIIAVILQLLEEPRVVISLRDPAARLWSHWRMKARSGKGSFESQSFEEYVERCEALEREGTQWQPQNKGYAALSQGRYSDYLTDWLDAFDDHLKILFFEKWASQPVAMMRELCRWLSISEDNIASIDYAVRNQGTSSKSRIVARLAATASRAGREHFQRNPRLKGTLRTIHDTMNKRDSSGSMDPSIRQRLNELYRDSSRKLATQLLERGYRDLPRWATDAMEAGTSQAGTVGIESSRDPRRSH